MILPLQCMDNLEHHVRTEIGKIANLVLAYRFPCKMFFNTEIPFDIVVFQKTEEVYQNLGLVCSTKFQNLAEFEIVQPCQESKFIKINEYFVQNPTHVLGKIQLLSKKLSKRANNLGYNIVTELKRSAFWEVLKQNYCQN